MTLFSNYDTVYDPRFPRDPKPMECQNCGSDNTFRTYDHKLVCRDCWKVRDI